MLFVQEVQAADVVRATIMEEHALRNQLAQDARKVCPFLKMEASKHVRATVPCRAWQCDELAHRVTRVMRAQATHIRLVVT